MPFVYNCRLFVKRHKVRYQGSRGDSGERVSRQTYRKSFM